MNIILNWLNNIIKLKNIRFGIFSIDDILFEWLSKKGRVGGGCGENEGRNGWWIKKLKRKYIDEKKSVDK